MVLAPRRKARVYLSERIQQQARSGTRWGTDATSVPALDLGPAFCLCAVPPRSWPGQELPRAWGTWGFNRPGRGRTPGPFHLLGSRPPASPPAPSFQPAPHLPLCRNQRFPFKGRRSGYFWHRGGKSKCFSSVQKYMVCAANQAERAALPAPAPVPARPAALRPTRPPGHLLSPRCL